MKVHLLVTGSLKEKYLKTAQEELLGRISSKSNISEIKVMEFKDVPVPDRTSDKEKEKIRDFESRRIKEYLKPGDFTVSLDIEGRRTNPSSLKKILEDASFNGYTRTVFIIGGSLGISGEIKKLSDRRISFSDLTYPHQLFRIALLEAFSLYL